ncbi:MAG: hypothetical protein KAI17_08275 [Thiotrichaceae bacterium]|nr:hypothetical protein [Thiotrichaceae bacterium]
MSTDRNIGIENVDKNDMLTHKENIQNAIGIEKYQKYCDGYDASCNDTPYTTDHVRLQAWWAGIKK